MKKKLILTFLLLFILSIGLAAQDNKLEGFVDGISNLKDSTSRYLLLSFKCLHVYNGSVSVQNLDEANYIAYLTEKKSFYKVVLNKGKRPEYSIIESDSLDILLKKIPEDYDEAFFLSLLPDEAPSYTYFYYKNKEGKHFYFNLSGEKFETLNDLLVHHFDSLANYKKVYREHARACKKE